MKPICSQNRKKSNLMQKRNILQFESKNKLNIEIKQRLPENIK